MGRELNTNLFFSNFSGAPGISQQNPRISRQKSLVSPGFEGHTELSGPHPFTWKTPTPPENIRTKEFWVWVPFSSLTLVAHDCGYPLSRYTCRATRVAAHFLDFIAFSTGVALHPLKILVSHLPPPVPGGVAPKFGSEKVSRLHGGVAATVAGVALHCATKSLKSLIRNRAIRDI